MTFKELRRASGMTQQQFAEYFKIPKRSIEEWERGARKCNDYLLDLMKYKLSVEQSQIIVEPSEEDIQLILDHLKNKRIHPEIQEYKTVHVVLRGMDCEGAEVQKVFANEKDAIKYLDEKFPKWKRISPTERRSTCESAFVEEWEVS